MRQALASAEEANKVKSQFLASMSHELRTPLNSIIGFSHRLRIKLGDNIDKNYADALTTIERNGNDLLGLINAVLDLSKVEAGTMDIHRDLVNINELAEKVIAESQALANGKGITLALEPAPIANIAIDRQRIHQVLANLLSNAIKFSDAGTVRLGFAHRAVNSVPGLLIKVQDAGKGIAPQDLPKLFQPYQQLGDTFRSDIGIGLGLALVRELILLHGGQVWAESQLGEGTVFYVWLPLDA